MSKRIDSLAKAHFTHAANGLAPSSRGPRLQSSSRKLMDGPFTEAKELAVAYWPAGRPPASPGRYAPVNGLRMYYEIHGRGRPLVLLHGAFTTIETSFGSVLPDLARNRQVIAIEQQAHGRTADIDRPLSDAQMADDTAELLRRLGIRQADFLGYSMGGSTALQIAVRHPGLVRKLAVVSGAYNREAYSPQVMNMFRGLDPMDDGWTKACRLEFQRVSTKPEQWPAAAARIAESFTSFRGLHTTQLRSIRAQTLVVTGDRDDMLFHEHVVEMSRLVPHARLEVCPGADHVSVLGHAAPLIPVFLEAPLPKAG